MLLKNLVPLIVVIILFVLGYNYLRMVRINSAATHFTGTYVINLDSSKLGPLRLSKEDSTLTLTIKKDKSFEFSHKSALNSELTGNWTMEGDDVTEHCVLVYKESKMTEQYFEIVEYKSIGVRGDFSSSGEIGLLYFDKISY